MQKKSKSNKKFKERRVTERRIKKRRATESGEHKSGDDDRRVAPSDRRVTIINRDKKEVSDRRS